MNRKSRGDTTKQKQELSTTTRLSQQVAQPTAEKRIQGYKPIGPFVIECNACKGHTTPALRARHEQTVAHLEAVRDAERIRIAREDRAHFALCIVPGCTGTKLEGRKYCAAHQERANGQTLAEKVKEQRHAHASRAEERVCEAEDQHAAFAALEHTFEWLSNHFEDFDADTNAQALCLSNEIETVLKATGGVPPAQESKTWTPPTRPGTPNAEECVKLCEALSAFWGDGVCDAPIWPGAFLTEEDTPIRDLIRAAVGWRKPLPGERDPLTQADQRMAAEDDAKTPPAMGEDDMERDRR